MQYVLTTRLTLGKYQLNFCTDSEIESSFQNLTDIAKITIPRTLFVESKPIVSGVNAVFKVGDKVKIEAGYNYYNDTVFTGYISRVKTTIPLVIECEDSMWLFKQQSYLKTFEKVTLKQLIDFLLTKIKTPITVKHSFPSLNLGKFRINHATGAQVLEELRKTYGIFSFFKEDVLYIGFAYSFTNDGYRKDIPLQFGQNIIEDNLLFKDAADTRVKIKATSIHSDNKQEVYETGDGDGQVIPVFYYNKSHAELKSLADNLQKTYKKSGFEGSVTTFGKPLVRQGDAVALSDYKIPERNGKYLVKKVNLRFGSDGYRQEIELDTKIS